MSTGKWDGLTGQARRDLHYLRSAFTGGPYELELLLIGSRFTAGEFYALACLKLHGFTLPRLLATPEHQIHRYLTPEEVLKVKWALAEWGLGIGLPQCMITDFGQRLTNA